jgi:Protein of unknown function (DUF2889)
VAFKGFRRRWIITPSPGGISAAVEDDYHCMAVAFDHDGVSITGVRAEMDRWPWSTCPGAEDVIRQTFTGLKLAEAAKRGEKTANCTHLYDLALLAARHALDAMSTRYDAMIADPAQGVVEAELLRDDVSLLHWTLANDEVIAPSELAGTNLFALKGWIASQSAPIQEAARLLQWATLIAHGREIPMERQSDATRMPPNCFTFQPDRAKIAVREGQIYDFSDATAEPLSHFDSGHFGSAPAGRKPIWPPA